MPLDPRDDPDDPIWGNVYRLRRRGGLPVLRAADLLALPKRGYLLKGILAPGELSVWWGTPKCGKTFLLMFIAWRLSQGRPVFGRRVKPVRVLYIAAEGRSGLRGRIEALTGVEGDAPDFMVVAERVNLLEIRPPGPVNSQTDTDLLIDLIGREKIDLIVVDTLNRAMGGGDENNSQDMGDLIGNLDRIRAETGSEIRPGVHVCVVHHGTKNGNSGPRGHSSLIGAADVVVEVAKTEDGARTATMTDAKDDAGELALGFRLRVLNLEPDDDGEPRTSCVVEEQEGSRSRARKPLGRNASLALRALTDEIADKGRPLPADDGFPSRSTLGVNTEEWRARLYDLLDGLGPSGRRSAFNRALPELLSLSRVGSHSGWAWLVQDGADG